MQQVVHIRLLRCEHDGRGGLSVVFTLATDLGDATWPSPVALQARWGSQRSDVRWSGTSPVQRASLTNAERPSTFCLAAVGFTEDGSLCEERFTGTKWTEGALLLPCHAVIEQSGKSTAQRRHFHVNGTQLTLTESMSETIEAHVWDGGLQLASLFACGELTLPRHGHIVELGAGTGLVGLTLSSLGHDILLTDLPRAEFVLLENIRLNGSRTRFQTLDWSTPPAATADALVMADVTYNTDSHVILLATIDRMSRPGTQIVFASKLRHEDELAFISRLCERYECTWRRRYRDVDVLVLQS